MVSASVPAVSVTYAWVRAIASLLLMTIGGAGIYAVVVALKPIAAEFDASRAAVSVAYAATSIGFAFGGLFMGWWSDRRGVAGPAILGGVAVGLGMVCVGSATSLWQLILFQGVLIGFFGNAAVMAPLVADITHWFVRHRGIAIAIVISGNYVAGAVWPPIVQGLIDEQGWRAAYSTIGVFCFWTMLPLAIFLARTARIDEGATPEERIAQTRPIGFSKLSLQCWICAAGVGCCVAMAMPQAHIVAHVTDLGFAASRGAEMLAVMLGCGVISRLTFGWMSDRVGGLLTLVIGSCAQMLALALFIPTTSLVALYAVAAFFGLSQGGIVPAYTVVIRTVFPAVEAGWRIALIMLFTLLGMALGGWMAGTVYDITGSYDMAFVIAIIFNAFNLAIAVRLLLRQRKFVAYGAAAAPA